MIRTQISLDDREYALVKKEAAALGISIAELVRRALRQALATNDRLHGCAMRAWSNRVIRTPASLSTKLCTARKTECYVDTSAGLPSWIVPIAITICSARYPRTHRPL